MSKHHIGRRTLLGMLALAAAGPGGLIALAGHARAEAVPAGLRLVMVDDPSCAYCRKWLAEVGPYYSTSRQGMRAPLVRRQQGDAGLAPFSRLNYTPTFLLVEDGREVGRLVGYSGARQFWVDLDDLLAKVDATPSPGPAPRPDPDEPARKGPSERDAGLPSARRRFG